MEKGKFDPHPTPLNSLTDLH